MSRLSGLFRKRGHHGAHMTRLSVSQAVHSASMCEDAGPGRGRGREREKEGGREAHRRRRRGRRPAETDHSSPGQLFTHRRTDGRGAAAATAPARTNLCSAYSSPLPAVRPSSALPSPGRTAVADAGSGGANERAIGERTAAEEHIASRQERSRCGQALPPPLQRRLGLLVNAPPPPPPPIEEKIILAVQCPLRLCRRWIVITPFCQMSV